MSFFDIENIAFELFEYPMSYVELMGSVFGFVSVYYASRANILTWPTGIVNEVFLFILFFQIQLYADMFLQVYFLVVTIYGWYYWNTKSVEKAITVCTPASRLLIALALVIAPVLLGYGFEHIHRLLPYYFTQPASYPYADSFVMVSSIIATVLLAKGKLETWLLWIAVDLVCVIIYFNKGIYFLSLEYLLFLGLAIYGWYSWKMIKDD